MQNSLANLDFVPQLVGISSGISPTRLEASATAYVGLESVGLRREAWTVVWLATLWLWRNNLLQKKILQARYITTNPVKLVFLD
ncbi:hypothetical protein SLE2022_037330 [Rubroshorea leprosula]